jgi:hypothetical protein
VGYEVELANYNTIPIPVPTAEEREDRNIVLKDCFDQKMGFLKALSDMSFLLSENASLFFDNLPPQEELLRIQGQYRTALNGLMAHAIKVSTGKMDPPQTFVANPAPPPLNFKKKPFSSAPVTIPDWGTLETMDRGGVIPARPGFPEVRIPSANELGLTINLIHAPFPAGMSDDEAADHEGDILSVSPPVGTKDVPRGAIVTVTFLGP